MNDLTVSQAHELLNKWYPNSTHCIDLELWQNVHNNKPSLRTEYRVTVFDGQSVSQQCTSNTLDNCIEKIKANKPQIGPPDPVAAADRFQNETDQILHDIILQDAHRKRLNDGSLI
jgi:hypothetical protein